jgi:uncharacterized membrane protein
MESSKSAGVETDASDESETLGRIITLSDGVFAIAITLLVLDIVPHIAASATGSEFVHQLRDMAPQITAYFLSFLVIGRFWDYHRTVFRFIKLGDSRVVWLNLIMLLWITLIPATAALLGSHWHEPSAIVLYGLNMILATASLWALWWYVRSAGYVRREKLHVASDRDIDRFLAISGVAYALAIAAAFINPLIALVLIFVGAALARILARQVLRRRAVAGSASDSSHG